MKKLNYYIVLLVLSALTCVYVVMRLAQVSDTLMAKNQVDSTDSFSQQKNDLVPQKITFHTNYALPIDKPIRYKHYGNDLNTLLTVSDEWLEKMMEQLVGTEFEQILTKYDENENSLKKINEKVLASYQIDKQTDAIYVKEETITGKQKEIGKWHLEFMLAIIPKEWRKELSTFQITETDAYIAGVYNDNDNTYDQIYKLNARSLESVYEQDRKQTIYSFGYIVFHELAHLFSHETNQRKYLNIPSLMSDYFTYLLTDEAYLMKFYRDFWKDVPSEWIDATRTSEQKKQFYELNVDNFVTAYSSVDPFEDFAESFAHFVLMSSESLAALETPVKQKIMFFYQFPELIQLRWALLERLLAYTETKMD